ncbi:MAG TPA: hypothetical protein VMV69_22240 [Pirellulales bacterium]|nr:hypothetical protein [Pirellulales bacterium]
MTPALLDTDMLSELLKLKNATVRQHALDYTHGGDMYGVAPTHR